MLKIDFLFLGITLRTHLLGLDTSPLHRGKDVCCNEIPIVSCLIDVEFSFLLGCISYLCINIEHEKVLPI